MYTKKTDSPKDRVLPRFFWGGVLFAWISLCTGNAWGAGMFLPGVGAKAVGRGGAFVASADDLTLLWHNPGNISKLRGIHVHIDNALVLLPYTFQRTAVDDKPFPKVENVAPPLYIPFLGASYDFGFLKLPKQHELTFAVGLYGPYEGKYWWDKNDSGRLSNPACEGKDKSKFTCNKNGPQRYSLIHADTTQIYLAFGLGYALVLPNITIRFGASFQLIRTETTQKLAVKLYKEPTTASASDLVIEVSGIENFRPGWNAGLTVELPFGLAIGASFKSPLDILLQGKMKLELPDAFASLVKINGENIEIALSLPWILRTGIHFQPPFFPRLQFEFAFVYEAWSSMQQVRLNAKDVTYTALGPEPQKLDPISFPRNWQDSLSFRFGADFAILPRYLFVRAGWFYETGSIPEAYTNVSEAHPTRHGIGVGVEGRIYIKGSRLSILASYGHTFHPTLEVKNGKERVTTVLEDKDAKPEDAEVINNGTYEGSFETFVLTLSFQW